MLSPAVGLHDAYAGIAVMMLLACALALSPRRDRGAPIVLTVCAAAFLVMSMGDHTPVLPWLVEHVPGFDLFRISNRYRIVYCLALAPLAAYGAAALIEAAQQADRARVVATAVTGAVAALAIGMTIGMDLEPQGLRAKATAVAVTLVAAAAITATVWAQRWAFAAVAVVAALIGVDAILYKNARPVFYMPRPDHDEDRDRLAGLDDVTTRWRIYDEFFLEQRAGSRLGVRDFRGYPSGDPLELVRYRDVLKFVKLHPEILEAYNVRYVLHAPHHVSGRQHQQVRDPTANGHATPLRPNVYELRHPAPLIVWYGRIRVVDDARDALDAVLAAEAPDGTRSHAVLERRQAERLGPDLLRTLAAAPSSAVTGELVAYASDRITVRVDAPADGVVVLNEIEYPGWGVRVDGRDARPLTADHLLRAVAVTAGSHDIEWTFSPRGFGGYRALWWGGVLVLLTAAAWPWLGRARSLLDGVKSRLRDRMR
jgi:hypothetical protein